MGRIKKDIEINSKKFWTLFDTGARNTYIIEDVAAQLPVFELKKIESVSLGGKVHLIKKDCRLEASVEGYNIRTNARIIDVLGDDEEGNKIQVLIGALAMQEWGIRLIPEEEKLDMTHYPKEFVEY